MGDISLAIKNSNEKLNSNLNVEKPKSGVSKEPSQSSERIWDKKFQPLIDANVGFGTQFNFKVDKTTGKKVEGWDDLVNYSNSLPLMKAVNGRYDAYLNKSDLDDKSKETLKILKNSSWAAMNEIDKISKGTGNIDSFLKYQKNALVADNKLIMQMGPKSKSNYVYDPDKKNIVDRVTFEKNNQEIKKTKRTSTETNVGEGKVNPYAGYIQTKGYLELSRNSVKDQVRPLVSSWAKNAYNYFNADDKAAQRFDPKNRDNTLNFSIDALKFISEYGTQSGNKDYDNANKEKAKNMVDKYRNLGRNENASAGRDSQIKYIKELTTGKTNQITTMIDDMGYYGSVFMYKKHKDVIGKNSKYYEGSEKYYGETDKLDEEIQSHEDYVAQEKINKIEAKDEAKQSFELSHKDLFFDNIVDNDGNIQSYHQFLKNAGYNARTRTLGRGIPDAKTGIISPPELYSAFQDLNNFWSGSSSRGVVTNVRPDQVKYFGGQDGRKYKEYETLYQTGDLNEFNGIMRKAYNETVKAYKKQFSLLNDPKKREKDMGSGNTADTVLYYDYVDMSLDKNGNLVNTQGEKANNVSKIFGMLQEPDNSVNTSAITLLDNDELKTGTYSKANKSTLDGDYLKNKNQVKFDNFFKNNDLSQMYVEFDRNSSVPYRSTYTFVNMKTGKKLAMIAPVDYIKEHKETIHAKTWMTVPEARFQKLGQLALPDVDDVYKNAAIIQKNGMKYATYQIKNADGVYKREEIQIGDTQIEVAKQEFLDYFKRLQVIKNMNSNLNY
jgi:hypothetical protein